MTIRMPAGLLFGFFAYTKSQAAASLNTKNSLNTNYG